MSEFESAFGEWLEGFEMTTAEIFYSLPERPHVLQSYIWQGLDKAPNYPVLNRFLDFWQRELDGPLHSVRIGTTEDVALPEVRVADYGVTVH
ncbi:MAG: usg protein [Hyphomicrobiales bacterium]